MAKSRNLANNNKGKKITAVTLEIIQFAVFKEQHPLKFNLYLTSGRTVLPTFLTGLAIANNSMYFRMGATKANQDLHTLSSVKH